MGFLPDPLHPALVHFPIALSMVAILFELAARHPRLRAFENAAGATVVLAALGSVAAVLSGNAAHDEAVVPPAAAPLIARHEEVGELAMWLLLALAVLRVVLGWRGWFKGFVPWVYLVLAAGVAGVVGYNGYLGGKMVFEHGLGTAPVQRQAPVKGSALAPAFRAHRACEKARPAVAPHELCSARAASPAAFVGPARRAGSSGSALRPLPWHPPGGEDRAAA